MTAPTRSTKQRTAIAALLTNVEEFRSAQELHDELRRRGEGIGLTTVYRTLQSMAAAGQVDSLRNDSGEALYDGPLAFSSGTTFTPSAPIPVLAGRAYHVTLRYLAGTGQQGFKRNEAGQFWLGAEGVQEQALYP